MLTIASTLLAFLLGLVAGILLAFRMLRRRGFIFMRHSDWVYSAKKTIKK